MRIQRSLGWTVAAVWLATASAQAAAEPDAAWPTVNLAPAAEVRLSGSLGRAALQRGVARLAQPPFDEKWLLADVSFEMKRIFTNYSGDASGRFIEWRALTSRPGRPSPATLAPLAAMPRYQKPDGHFGVEMDLTRNRSRNGSPPIPMLWGNGRLLVGLVTAAERVSRPAACWRPPAGWATITSTRPTSSARREPRGRVSCQRHLWRRLHLLLLPGHRRAWRCSTARPRTSVISSRPSGWPSSSASSTPAHRPQPRQPLRLAGHPRALRDHRRAAATWTAPGQVGRGHAGGFVWPLGGIGEHWYVSFGGDEGCSESDWLRFCLDLWRFTGETRYLDVAERLLDNQYHEPVPQRRLRHAAFRRRRGRARSPTAASGGMALLLQLPRAVGTVLPQGLPGRRLGARHIRQFPAAISPRRSRPGGHGGRSRLAAKPDFLQGHARLEIELPPWTHAPASTPLPLRGRGEGELAAAGSHHALGADAEWASAAKVTCRGRAGYPTASPRASRSGAVAPTASPVPRSGAVSDRIPRGDRRSPAATGRPDGPLAAGSETRAEPRARPCLPPSSTATCGSSGNSGPAKNSRSISKPPWPSRDAVSSRSRCSPEKSLAAAGRGRALRPAGPACFRGGRARPPRALGHGRCRRTLGLPGNADGGYTTVLLGPEKGDSPHLPERPEGLSHKWGLSPF